MRVNEQLIPRAGIHREKCDWKCQEVKETKIRRRKKRLQRLPDLSIARKEWNISHYLFYILENTCVSEMEPAYFFFPVCAKRFALSSHCKHVNKGLTRLLTGAQIENTWNLTTIRTTG